MTDFKRPLGTDSTLTDFIYAELGWGEGARLFLNSIANARSKTAAVQTLTCVSGLDVREVRIVNKLNCFTSKVDCVAYYTSC